MRYCEVLDAAKSLVTGDCALDGMVKVFVWDLDAVQAMSSAHLLAVFADEEGASAV